jgi:aldehyde dehydrogenase (NAD+)/betaine-aldehyde dehydrogenase
MTAAPVAATAALSIAGRLVAGRGPVVDVPNPATEELLASVALASTAQVDEAVSAARRAGPGWAAASPAARSQALHRLAAVLERHRDELLATLIAETGCPVGTARALQVGFPLTQLRWYADAALRDRSVELGPTQNGAATGRVELRPVGVVAAISAYNYPLHLALWKIAPALAAGCTVVAVPSPRAPLAVLRLGALAREADLPPGVLSVVACDRDAARHLTAHPDVDKVSFTGSDAVGAEVAVQAARDIRRVTLELGGKSAALVLPGADLRAAAAVVH